MLNGLDLFSGIGGNSLALGEYINTIAYCEQDKYAQHVLLSRMSEGLLSNRPIWDDVCTLQGSMLPTIDIIVGGFPCQDISVAGHGKGLEGKRSGLFYEIVRLTKEIHPKFVFLENVPAIRTRGLREVVRAFTDLRYDCRWTCVSAAEVGAPHLRKRWFLLAHTNSAKLREQSGRRSGSKGECPTFPGINGSKEHLADTKNECGHDITTKIPSEGKQFAIGGFSSEFGLSRGFDWKLESDVGGTFNGFSVWLDTNNIYVDQIRERINYYALSEETDPREILRIVQQEVGEKVLQQSTRGFECVSSEKVLQSCLFRVKNGGINETRIQLESEKVSKDDMRVMWHQEELAGSPYRPRHKKQRIKQHTNTMHKLSQLLALDSEKAWAQYRRENAAYNLNLGSENWEDGFARVANGVPNRVDRLKCLGNAVVPLQAKEAFERLMGLKI